MSLSGEEIAPDAEAIESAPWIEEEEPFQEEPFQTDMPSFEDELAAEIEFESDAMVPADKDLIEAMTLDEFLSDETELGQPADQLATESEFEPVVDTTAMSDVETAEAWSPEPTDTYVAPPTETSTDAWVGSEYTVERNDTLWEIANRVIPSSDVSVQQMMLAIFEANPRAFNGNINRLKADVVLQLPDYVDVIDYGLG
ncbi:MAG: LysM peptidoglycan-binding domain-containing protein, partial [Gammaproteobacteria bacterium]|nr:LysM peptidoglycan-binding domain-containing protein [Gammaproteobacteria bacterium]